AAASTAPGTSVEPQRPPMRPAGESVDAEVVPGGPTAAVLQQHTDTPLQPAPAEARTVMVTTTSQPPGANGNEVPLVPYPPAMAPAGIGVGGSAPGVETTDPRQSPSYATPPAPSAAVEPALPTAPLPTSVNLASPRRPAETSDGDPWSALVSYD